MSRRVFTVAITVLWCCVSHAQDTPLRWSLFTNTTQNIDLSHPKLNLGVEAEHAGQAVFLSVGAYYRNPWSQLYASGSSVEVGWRGRFIKEWDLTIATSLGHVDYDAAGGYPDSTSAAEGDTAFMERYRIEKTLFNVYATLSRSVDIGRHLWIRPFFGLGFRYKWSAQPGREKPFQPQYGPDLNMAMFRDRLGDHGVPTVRCGVLIGFRISR